MLLDPYHRGLLYGIQAFKRSAGNSKSISATSRPTSTPNMRVPSPPAGMVSKVLPGPVLSAGVYRAKDYVVVPRPSIVNRVISRVKELWARRISG